MSPDGKYRRSAAALGSARQRSAQTRFRSRHAETDEYRHRNIRGAGTRSMSDVRGDDSDARRCTGWAQDAGGPGVSGVRCAGAGAGRVRAQDAPRGVPADDVSSAFIRQRSVALPDGFALHSCCVQREFSGIDAGLFQVPVSVRD